MCTPFFVRTRVFLSPYLRLPLYLLVYQEHHLPCSPRPVDVVVPRHPRLDGEVRSVSLAHLLVVKLLQAVRVLGKFILFLFFSSRL